MLHRNPKAISPEEYTEDYYSNHAEGYIEYKESQGRVLPKRLYIPLSLGKIQPGMIVLDIGCGRGEIVYHASKLGALVWGMDYAIEAVKLSKRTLDKLNQDNTNQNYAIQLSDSINLPFKSNCADVIFLLDIVEHLIPEELTKVLKEVHRVLSTHGILIIHTMPNLWYYHYGYPIYQLFQSIRGKKLPNNPRERWAYANVHVNEQTPKKLARILRSTGYKYKIFLKSTQEYREEDNLIIRSFMAFLTKFILTKSIFCNDIFAICKK